VKVGCIGLGDIAQKVYLPVLALQPGIDLHLQTQTPATLHRVAESLHVTQDRRHTDLDGLLAQDLDAAFVHAPTAAHPGIVTRLLETGVPTYVDKPLAYRLADSERLVHLAEERNVSLAVGFNRRNAPGYVACSDHPRDLILMQKNRVGLPEEPRKMILDDFIHVVDTLRFLVPGTVDDVTVRARVEGRPAAPRGAAAVRRRIHRAGGHEPRERFGRGDPGSLRTGLQAADPQPRRDHRPHG
jgi:virulence factor